MSEISLIYTSPLQVLPVNDSLSMELGLLLRSFKEFMEKEIDFQ